MAAQEELVTLHLDTPAPKRDDAAANGAPVGEPEAWAPNIADFNPHLRHTPEPEPISVSPAFAADANFSIDDYLADERSKDLLRFSTAGSVDDGKSTLIGRLLYDTQSVYDDQVRSIEGKGTTAPGVLDLALLTDGLRAEREQGITIDVAYRYFSTARRKFIIADTPGHEQYTRNMATGASTADVAIVLVDARKGVLVQSRRHAYITALLGVSNVIVAVNKMDLVAYQQATFDHIRGEFENFFRTLDVDGSEAMRLHFVPVSALTGENVVHGSGTMPWYTGPALLTLLESLPATDRKTDSPFRMAAQRVVRPDLDFRGFAGQIASGTVRPGDSITVLPSGRSSRIARIVTFDGDLAEAAAPLSVTLTLEDEIDISRGDLFVTSAKLADVATSFIAALVWMDATPLDLTRRYLLKHMSRTVPAQVTRVLSITDLSQLTTASADTTLQMNGIAHVEVATTQPLAFDAYSSNRHTGSFVLIDRETNATVAAGMIRSAASNATLTPSDTSEVTGEQRAQRYGHTAAVLHVSNHALAVALERALFDLGCLVTRVERVSPDALDALLHAGALVITQTEQGADPSLAIDDGEPQQLAQDLPFATAQAVDLLHDRAILHDRRAPHKGDA